jgi:hypothetical protein
MAANTRSYLKKPWLAPLKDSEQTPTHGDCLTEAVTSQLIYVFVATMKVFVATMKV